ncbi:MAG: enoyl-CoA hydratase/isomerase family protein, partial [Pseudonocardia sp.]|nr:enoyl-CoA hydratase/isomerase family protein [Pseudonocardia sp.]
MKQDYSTLSVNLDAGVAELRLNRPDKANALSRPMWQELREAARDLDATPEARVVVLAGAGRHFCAGIDLGMLAEFEDAAGGTGCPGRAGERMHATITDLQDVLTWFERCRKPVLAAVHGACVGAG